MRGCKYVCDGFLLKNIDRYLCHRTSVKKYKFVLYFCKGFGAGISLSAGIDEELTKVLIITHEYLEDICLKDITCFAFLY